MLSGPLRQPVALRRRLLALLLPLAAMLNASPAVAETGAVALERSVKAAFIYKFLGYTEFPAYTFADAGAPVVIGVVGSEEMAGELGRIVAGRTVDSRPIAVRQMREGDNVGVHLLFVAGADCGRATRVLRQSSAPMLLVTECGNGLEAGSIINFKIVDQRVRFDVSLDAADKNNIKLSSRLLTVANHVSKGAP
ncbi:MAG: hypothetical protein JWQ01_4398 [Massilia sp.]|jgi:hypothetical protein|nr:hypothetical protein [Massilia sp.]